MPQRKIELENEKYVLQALAEAKNGAGAREITIRAGRFLREDGKRRKLTEDQARAVLASLEAQGKVSERRTDPATWQITFEGKKYLLCHPGNRKYGRARMPGGWPRGSARQEGASSGSAKAKWKLTGRTAPSSWTSRRPAMTAGMSGWRRSPGRRG